MSESERGGGGELAATCLLSPTTYSKDANSMLKRPCPPFNFVLVSSALPPITQLYSPRPSQGVYTPSIITKPPHT